MGLGHTLILHQHPQQFYVHSRTTVGAGRGLTTKAGRGRRTSPKGAHHPPHGARARAEHQRTRASRTTGEYQGRQKGGLPPPTTARIRQGKVTLNDQIEEWLVEGSTSAAQPRQATLEAAMQLPLPDSDIESRPDVTRYVKSTTQLAHTLSTQHLVVQPEQAQVQVPPPSWPMFYFTNQPLQVK